MAWTPANYSSHCGLESQYLSCSFNFLTFLALVNRLFNKSVEEKCPRKINSNSVSDNEVFDFVMVGAGSAGCVLANRLSEIYNWKILLLEVGDEEPMITDVPAFAPFLLLDSSLDWGYRTQPEKNACKSSQDHTCGWPRGKVMGGSSAINLMLHTRGHPEDYDEWAQPGNDLWSFDKVRPYFERLEGDPNTNEIPDALGRQSSFFQIQHVPYTDTNMPLFINAWQELGYQMIDDGDVNQIGISYRKTTTNHGVRTSTNTAYIRPIRSRRPNLVVQSNAKVHKLIINESSKRTIGLQYICTKTNKTKKVFVKKEIILSAGVIDSPKLLMLSGIGPAESLKAAGIKVIENLPVGNNLQDHISLPAYSFHLSNETSKIKTIEEMTNDLKYWLKNKNGPLSSLGMKDLAIYSQSKYENRSGIPDVQYSFQNIIYEDLLRNFNEVPKIRYYPQAYYNGISLSVSILKPGSRGYLILNETDPFGSQPLIYANYLSNEADLKVLIDGAMSAKKIFDTKIFKNFGLTPLDEPKRLCKHMPLDTEAYFECVAVHYTTTASHPVGTCKMGLKTDPGSVVDQKLRVHGISGLRVIDASIMPTIPRANTNAPTVMIAERASDLIKEDWGK